MCTLVEMLPYRFYLLIEDKNGRKRGRKKRKGKKESPKE